MEPFTTHTGRAVPLRRSNVDTDQIIPAVYLKRVTRTGFADGLFRAWREDPGFVLNRPEYAEATVLVAGPDFGTGSSREHAVWALRDHGFRAVVSVRFADIFRSNSLKGGLLAVELPQEAVERLWDLCEAAPATEVTVDLVARQVRAGDHAAGAGPAAGVTPRDAPESSPAVPGASARRSAEATGVAGGGTGFVAGFDIDDYTRWRLLEGLDDIALTMRHVDAITAYEARRPAWLPSTAAS